MIVEDSPVPMMDLKHTLIEGGYDVVAVEVSGEGAVTSALEKKPDVILMDIMLEGKMTGVEAAKNITDSFSVPIIFISGYSDNVTVDEVKEVNPYGYLLKPVEDRELFIALELALKRMEFEKKAEAGENRYRRLFYDSRDPILIVDKNGRFIDFNTSLVELFQYDREEIFSMRTVDFYFDGKRLKEIDRKFKKDGFVKDYETDLKKKDGTLVNCMLSGSLVTGVSGELSGYQSIIHDVTLMKKIVAQRKESIDELRRTVSGIIEAMGMTLQAKDPYTAGHQKRVAALACAIADKMQLDDNNKEGIRMTALIHDLGKIYVPSEILSKPGRISDLEFELVKTHSSVGYDILKQIDFPWPLATTVYQHHERVNGSGYPEGLTGTEIVNDAKIIAVADVIEAISSHRPYRAALGIEAALAEITSFRGILYDEEVVDVTVELIRKDKFRFTDIDDY